jgi:hypothetical protein
MFILLREERREKRKCQQLYSWGATELGSNFGVAHLMS